MQYDVIIVGAGLSGLSAALLLSDSGLRVIVLEANDRLGGRVYTVQDAACGGHSELGGTYFGPQQRRVVRLANRFGVKFSESHRSVYCYNGKWTRAPSLIFQPLAAFDVWYLTRCFERMTAAVPVSAPWSADLASEWDSMTLKEFLGKTCWTKHAQNLAAVVCRSILCAEPHEISLLSFLWYMACGGGFICLAGAFTAESECTFDAGAQRLVESMATSLSDKIHLKSPVVRIDQSNGSVTVHTEGGDSFSSRYAIVSVPQTMLNRLEFVPALSATKLQLVQRIPMGSVIKTMTYYDKPYWKNSDLKETPFSSDLSDPVAYCVDCTKHDGKAPCLWGSIVASKAVELGKLTMEQRKQTLAEHYADRFCCQALLKPVHYVEKNWSADEFIGGGYVFNYPPGVLTSFGSELRQPFGAVYFAGTETATYWAGCLEGAVQSGERAAREVLHSMGEIPASQIWQDEPSVGEQKTEETARGKKSSSVLLVTAGTVSLIAVVALCLRRHWNC